MTEFILQNHKMDEFSQGKRAVDQLGRRASARLGRGSVEACTIDWSTQGQWDARAGTRADSIGDVRVRWV
jgi:hypothetical protein